MVEMLALLGSIDLNLSRHAQADQELGQALALTAPGGVGGDGRRGAILHDICLLRSHQDRDADAHKACEEAVALRERAFGPESDEVAATLNLLGGIYADALQAGPGEPLLRRALAIRNKLDPEGTGAADVHRNLGRLLTGAGRFEEAEAELRRALAIYRAKSGTEGADAANAMDNLRDVLTRRREYAEAEQLELQAISLTEKQYGRDSDNVAQMLIGLGSLYKTQGRNADAELIFRRSLAIEEKLFGPESINLSTSLNGLAGALSNQGKNEESEMHYLRGIGIVEKSGDTNTDRFAGQLNDLGVLYLNMRRASAVACSMSLSAPVVFVP